MTKFKGDEYQMMCAIIQKYFEEESVTIFIVLTDDSTKYFNNNDIPLIKLAIHFYYLFIHYVNCVFNSMSWLHIITLLITVKKYQIQNGLSL